MMKPIVLKAGRLGMADLRRIAARPVPFSLARGWRAKVEKAARVIQRVLARDEAVYGINTGFGRLAQTRIEAGDLCQLQRNLVLSHCTGTGPLLDDDTVRLVLALKINCLAQGRSGVRPELIEALLRLLEAEVYPCLPAKGSVGASGDLAPLAHLAAPLIGEGSVRHGGEVMAAADGLAAAGMQPIELHPKEGLALLNGTQVSTALALQGLFAAEDLFAAALLAGALSVDAAKGSDTPFDPRIHELRGQAGQIAVAAAMRELLRGSEIRRSHLGCGRVQDPYSLRCQPQVMGACLDQLRHSAGILAREANAVTDNPLVFAETGDILSGGNFHAEPVAFAADNMALAIAEIGALSERRIALLIDPAMTDLPAFLVAEGGLNSGFMVAHVTAAALASENKSLAHPASVDSLPTSANQEDHVSMSTFAARRLAEMVENSRGIVAIELLAACQALEFRRPLKSSDVLEKIHATVRTRVKPWDKDRNFAPDIEAATDLVASGLDRAHVEHLFDVPG
jgi:histidine ammonia-lyase